MKTLLKVAWLGLGMGCFLQTAQVSSASDSNGPQTLKFDFELNHPLLFSVESTTKNLSDRTLQLDTGNKSMLTKNAVETRYKMRLTPVRKAKDGTWTIHYEPLDLEQDLDVAGNNGHIVTTVRGLEVKSTQNGIVVVDTARGVGIGQAKSLKQVVYPKMLSGYFNLDSKGEISKFDGDLPFIDVWTDLSQYQLGFFDIVFPSAPVPPGGTWTANLALKNLEGLKLGDEGIVETNEFVREDDASSSPNHVETFSASAAFNSKDIMGSMDTMGQSTMLNISQFNLNKSGKFQFDPGVGCMLNGNEDESVKISMDMLVQGHTVSVTMDLQTNTKFELLKN